MKKAIFHIRTVAIAVFATVAFGTITVPASAARNRSNNVKPVLQPAVTFLGAENENAFFSIQLGNSAPVKFLLTITDAEGNRIFSQQFDAANFSKTFKLVNEATVASPIDFSFHFEVVSTGEKHEFEISTATQIVKDVQVTRI